MKEIPIKTAFHAGNGRGFALTGATFNLCGCTHERVAGKQKILQKQDSLWAE